MANFDHQGGEMVDAKYSEDGNLRDDSIECSSTGADFKDWRVALLTDSAHWTGAGTLQKCTGLGARE